MKKAVYNHVFSDELLAADSIMQTYKNHAHRPILTAVGYWFVGIALISFWLAGEQPAIGRSSDFSRCARQ